MNRYLKSKYNYMLSSMIESFVKSLIESKNLGSFRGSTQDKDQLAQTHSNVVPNLSALQSRAHQRASGSLDTLINRFRGRVSRRLMRARHSDDQRPLQISILKDEFREIYTQAYILGLKGSTLHLTPISVFNSDDKRFVESAFRHEMTYFNRFLTHMFERNLSQAQIQSRINMYMSTIKAIYDAGRVNGSHKDSLIHWVYNHEAVHCAGCIWLRDHSPYTKSNLPTQPKAGSTDCYSNCRCHLRVVITDPEIVAQTQARNPGREAMLRTLQTLKRR